MKFFKWRIISEERYQRARDLEVMHATVVQMHRWFSGWTDLDIIWDYLMGKNQFGSMWTLRQKYADARGTTVYGKPLEKSREENEKPV